MLLTPLRAYNFTTQYTRNLNERYEQQLLTNLVNEWEYWSIGPIAKNNIGGPQTKTQIIQRYVDEYNTQTNKNNLKSELYMLTEIWTNEKTYTGDMVWSSNLQIDPNMYDKANITLIDLYWDYGWNITTFDSIFSQNYDNATDINNQINSIENQIINQNGSHKTVYEGTKASDITAYQNTINMINDQANNGKSLEENTQRDYSYAWLTKIVLNKSFEGIADQQTKNIYSNILDSYKEEITFYMDITNATPIVENYEVIDLPGFMFTILGLPFAWISTAFNLTLFPGTPYSLNIAHLFMAIIGALILVFVLKKILK